MTPQELRDASTIGLVYIVRMLGLFMVLPVLPLSGGSISGATVTLIGVAIGIYGLSQGLFQIPLGMLSDRIGRRPVVIGGLMIFVVGSVVAAVSDDIYGLIVGRLLQGCGAISGTLMALAADATRPSERTTAMAIIGACIGGSFGLAFVLGPLLASRYGLAGIFWTNAGLGVVGTLLVAFMRVPERPQVDANLSLRVGRLLEVLRNTSLLRLNFSIFALHFLLMATFMIFPAHLVASGVDNHALAYLVVLGATFVLAGPFMRKARTPASARPIMLAMIAAFIVSMGILMGDGLPMLYLGMGVFFFAFNLLEVVLPATVTRVAPAGARGTALGVYATCQFVGTFAGGALGGWITDLWSMSHLLYVNAGLAFIWLLLLYRLKGQGNVENRRIALSGMGQRGANQLYDALSSIEGVVDIVRADDDESVYLKVDTDRFDEASIDVDNLTRSVQCRVE